MPKLTFFPPMLSGGRSQTRFSTSSPGFLLCTGSQQLLMLPQQRPWTFKAICRDRPLSLINMDQQRGTVYPHISVCRTGTHIFSDWIYFSERTECHWQLVSAKWAKNTSFSQNNKNRKMLSLESQSSLWQRKVSSAPMPESFSVPGRKIHLKAEVIFLQESSALDPVWMNGSMHDLKKKKLH